MKVLVVGANGFIGKNLCVYLKQREFDCLKIDKENLNNLPAYINNCDFIIHLAGTNRNTDYKEFKKGNVDSLSSILEYLTENKFIKPIFLSSSIQAENESIYGTTKKEAEDELISFYKETNSPIYIYRLTNVFGKWCKPNYNSVIATLCYNIARNLPINIIDPSILRDYLYIDDLCEEIFQVIKGNRKNNIGKVNTINNTYRVSLGELAHIIKGFKEGRESLRLPLMDNGFCSKLYATYLSYLDESDFAYMLESHKDERGSFTELVKTAHAGQISVNVGKPGIVKGNHYHNLKNEKFICIKGKVSIKFRKIDTPQIIEYIVDDKEFKVVDIPPGYTHSITNIGIEDSITIMWASEPFDKDNPDTYYEEVIQNGK